MTRKYPEFPFIVREDVSPEPASPRHEISFLEQLWEAEREAASLLKKPRHVGAPDEVGIYIHVDYVREILERVAEQDVDIEAILLAFKPLA